MIQPPAKRFWKAELFSGEVFTDTTRMGAFKRAADRLMELPQEVTA